jgi:S-adenosyl methyltransferase
VAITLLTISILIQDAEDLYGIVRRLLDAVPSGSYLAISHAAGGRKSRAPPRSEEREPVNGLIAKDEADVTIRDPLTHRGGGGLLLEEAIGDLQHRFGRRDAPLRRRA